MRAYTWFQWRYTVSRSLGSEGFTVCYCTGWTEPWTAASTGLVSSTASTQSSDPTQANTPAAEKPSLGGPSGAPGWSWKLPEHPGGPTVRQYEGPLLSICGRGLHGVFHPNPTSRGSTCYSGQSGSGLPWSWVSALLWVTPSGSRGGAISPLYVQIFLVFTFTG